MRRPILYLQYRGGDGRSQRKRRKGRAIIMIPRKWLVVAGVALLIGAASWLLTPVGGPLPRATPVAPAAEAPGIGAPDTDAAAEQTAPTPIPSPTASPVASPAQLAGDSPPASPGDALVSPLATATAAPLPVYTYEIVAAHPHDPQAFTQGLIYVDGVLYEGTGLYGRSSLRRVTWKAARRCSRSTCPCISARASRSSTARSTS